MRDELRDELEPAYLLHLRAYRNTSAIVDFFTVNHGRVSAIAKGIYGRSKLNQLQRGMLQPFQPLLIGWRGKNELKTLSKIELIGSMPGLHGQRLYSAFYVNEILMRLLRGDDAHPILFQSYRETLVGLQSAIDIEIPLRVFELNLLRELGYALCFTVDSNGKDIQADLFYRYDAQIGFICIGNELPEPSALEVYSGDLLLAIDQHRWAQVGVRRAAKHITRHALLPHIGGKPLRSRALFS